MKRLAVLLVTFLSLVVIVSCGGSSSNSSTGQKSGLTHRAFVTNNFSGRVLIIDSQNDQAAYTTTTTTNSSGQQVTVTTPVGVNLGGALTWEAVSPNRANSAIFDANSNLVYFVTNSSEAVAGSATIGGSTGMGVFSADSANVYVPIPTLPISGEANGGVQVVSGSSFNVTSYAVPNATYVALSPGGTYLLVFATNSDSIWVLNITGSPVTVTQYGGFARPVNAFFTSDNAAFVLNCGPECGSGAGPASVSQFDPATGIISKTVPVGGASVGTVKGNTLYVAGNPGPAGTVDAVDISTMTRTTANSIPISDGYHSKMAISSNNKLYVGAKTCTNIVTGCLSVVDLTTMAADPALGPTGNVTGMQAIANRNTMYVVQKGYLAIYDTTTNTLQATQIVFTGALWDVLQIDP